MTIPLLSINVYEGTSMGNWGIRALQSDEGLDVLDRMREILADRTDVRMADFLERLRSEGMLPGGAGSTDVSFLYDKCATATTELLFEFREKGHLDYDDGGFRKLRSFTAGAEELEYLLHMLQDIRAGKPGRRGFREYTNISLAGPGADEWRAHMDDLIGKLSEALDAAKP